MRSARTMTDCTFEELAHTSEIGLRVRAPTPEGLFPCAAVGMFTLLGAPEAATEPATRRVVRLAAPDAETLLVDWLGELVYLFQTTGVAYVDCEVSAWSPGGLEAVLHGYRPAGPPRLDIKAVTYHGLFVGPGDGGWQAEVYFDI